ncbi:TonB-dependent receptor [Oceanicoccus sagamiensis]|uniref:TonB-dependent receptor n=1 Tax=Oceanicoccus sagamiensis TaxID=716816 RepID=A0A1X9NKG6_9GAMM|nr:TonB-dependent receptor [Oceanicoccus sagamiensis]ARN75939.1 TonB-dependent receptor [Oceanicoccus sagamiensis]
MAYSKSVVKPIVAGILLSSVAQSGMLSAQVLEEIIVTAQLRAESLQDVPVSVSAISGSKMMEAGIDKIEDLQAYVPNLTMSETGIGTNIYIRGIGSGINQGFEQSTGMYIDGVSYGRAQLSRAPFLDLERVEVLRGPQNILFGKNSIAGALSMITAKPGDEFEGSVSALYEPDAEEEVYDLMLSGPITDRIGARLAYRNRSMDGYMENLTNGDDEPGRDEETIRFIINMDVTDDLDISLKYESGDFDVTGRQIEIVEEEPSDTSGLTYAQILFAGGGGVFPPQDISVLNNTQDYRRSSNGDYSENSTENITLTANYAVADHTLTVIAASNSYDYEELCDCDFTGANVFLLLSEEDYEQYSFEARIASDVGQTFEYIGGMYYQDSDLEFTDDFQVAANSIIADVVNVNPAAPAPGLGEFMRDTSAMRDFQQDSELWSVFAQVTWNIADDMRLTLGGRYSDEEKEASRAIDVTNPDGSALTGAQAIVAPGVYDVVFGLETHEVADKRTEDNFAPLITGEWDMNEEVMLYATASQGYKSGGFDVRSNAAPPTGTFEFGEEEATSFEFGAKTSLLDGAAELNVAMFFTQYDDLQVSVFDGQVGFNVGNAAEAETQGIELDGRLALTDSLTLSGAIAFLDFEFKDFKTGQCNQGQVPDFPDGNCDYTGDTNQYVADWSGNLSLDYFTAVGESLEFRSTLDVIFTDDYNPSQTLDPELDQDGYAKVNARIALSDNAAGWEVAVVGKNLTDEDVMTYGNATPLAFSIFGAKSRYAFFERDRSVAIQGVYRF